MRRVGVPAVPGEQAERTGGRAAATTGAGDEAGRGVGAAVVAARPIGRCRR